MTLLLALVVLAHLWGDLILQTDRQAAEKARCWRAMAGHLLSYHLLMGAVAVWAWGLGWSTAVFLAVSAFTHGLLDRRWPVVWLITVTRSPAFARTRLGVFTVDQALHLTVLILTTAALTGGVGR